MTFGVVEPGALTTVQDAVGRRGWRHLGVPIGGAVDRWSARLANLLVGNAEGAALLELTLTGPTLAFTRPATVALVGDLDATADGLPLPSGSARVLHPGSEVRVGGGREGRAWLAVGGGIDVPVVLGSRSTDLRSGFGGLEGRPLRSGDRLIGAPRGPDPGYRWTGSVMDGPIRVVPGPHEDRVPPGALASTVWRIGGQADRTGVRLHGPPIEASGAEVPSMGLPEGAIQLPPDGTPIVMLADRPVTGGYPVPWVVIGADVGRIARLRPGDPVTFATVSVEEARGAWLAAERQLRLLEPIGAGEDDESGSWAGSHA